MHADAIPASEPNAPDAIPSQLSTREQVDRLEQFILQVPQVDLKTRHHFANGLYAREIFIPAGTVLTGAAHRFEHINICVGDITVLTDEGMRRITGHHTLVTKPGMKRVGLAHADTVWTTIIACTERDLEKLEDLLVEESDRLQTRTLHLAPEILTPLGG